MLNILISLTENKSMVAIDLEDHIYAIQSIIAQ